MPRWQCIVTDRSADRIGVTRDGGRADVRVYLFTYRRNDLLPRALNSLLRQTHTNWVCELHNDDPDDTFPGELVAHVNDSRIVYVRHERNLGPTRTFNYAFRPVREGFVSLLEDDNWWEPEMLARLLPVMAQHPEVNLAWVNSRLWRETDDGSWQPDGTIWPDDRGDPIAIFHPPAPRQACRAIHSHGAMVLRVLGETMFPCPPTMPIFAIEPVRERAYPGPLLLVREPLANFAITRHSWRRETADENLQILVLLAQTLIEDEQHPDDFYCQMWLECQGSRGHQHRALIVAAALAGRLGRMLKGARGRDLALVAGWALRYPWRLLTLFRARERFPDVHAFLVWIRVVADLKSAFMPLGPLADQTRLNIGTTMHHLHVAWHRRLRGEAPQANRQCVRPPYGRNHDGDRLRQSPVLSCDAGVCPAALAACPLESRRSARRARAAATRKAWTSGNRSRARNSVNRRHG